MCSFTKIDLLLILDLATIWDLGFATNQWPALWTWTSACESCVTPKKVGSQVGLSGWVSTMLTLGCNADWERNPRTCAVPSTGHDFSRIHWWRGASRMRCHRFNMVGVPSSPVPQLGEELAQIRDEDQNLGLLSTGALHLVCLSGWKWIPSRGLFGRTWVFSAFTWVCFYSETPVVW